MKLIDRAIELSERIVRRDGDDVTLTQGGQSIPLLRPAEQAAGAGRRSKPDGEAGA